jgi:hypothetical protein
MILEPCLFKNILLAFPELFLSVFPEGFGFLLGSNGSSLLILLFCFELLD